MSGLGAPCRLIPRLKVMMFLSLVGAGISVVDLSSVAMVKLVEAVRLFEQ